MAVSCTVFEINQDIGRKGQFFIPVVFNLHDPLKPLQILPKILIQTARVPELLGGAKILPKSSSLSMVQQRYRQRTDGRTAHAVSRT